MPRKVIPIKSADPHVRICGNCEYFDQDDGESYGECFLNPPTVIADEAEVGSARPQVENSDKACSGFKQRLQS